MENGLEENPLVYVVVLNWNNAADTIECLRSLEKSKYEPFDTLVIDNGSTNGSVGEIRKVYPDLQLLELDTNTGYANGNNIGIQRALDSGADYVMILNNDTLVDPMMLDELVSVAESSSTIGMIGPKMYCFDPANKIFAAGSFINWISGQTTHRGFFQQDSSVDHMYEPEAVDFIAGCGVLVSREFIKQVGLLDTIYFLNIEDVDWGERGRQHGFQIMFAPRAVMWHKVSGTLGKASPKNTYYMTRNSLLFFWRHTPLRFRLLTISRITFRTLRTIFTWTVKSKYRNETYRNLRSANILALRDFVLGKFGRGSSEFSNLDLKP